MTLLSKYMPKRERLLTVITLVLMMVCASQSQLLLNSITTDNSTILAPATYTITFSRFATSNLPLNSYLLLTFASDYVGLIATTPTCLSNSFGPTKLSCIYSGTSLFINNIFSNSAYLSLSSFTIAVSNITNPLPATDYTPVKTAQIISNTSAIVESATSSVILTITQGVASCTTTILNPFVYQNGQISVTYSSKYIPSDSTGYNLTIEMDASYPDDLTSTDIAPTLSAPVSQQVSPGSYILEIVYTRTFTITMLMPPSTKPESNFILIYSYNSIGDIDSCSISISQISPNTFTSITVSQETVQTLSSMKFDLTLSTPLSPTDYLIIEYDSSFDLSKVGTSLTISGYGVLTLTKIGNTIQITSISQQAIINARLIFNISGVLMPFTSASKYINISLATSEKYYRIVQNYAYSPFPGSIVSSVTCLNAEIGTVNTYCIFSIKTSSSLTSDALFNIVLPNQFPLSSGSSFCAISATGLNSMTNCLYFATNNTIQAGSLKSTSGNIAPLSMTINITMSISQYVGTYSVAVSSQSSGSIVDQGTASLVTTSRKLKSSQFYITSSSMVTYTSTIYTIYFSLPFNLGVTYTIVLDFPFDAQPGLNVTVSGATLVSFTSQVLTLSTSQVTSNAAVAVSGLMTPSSLRPTTASISINYQNVTYFYGSSTLTMSQIKAFSFITVSQSNQMVFAPAIATVTLSNLFDADKVVIVPSYSYFYAANQSNCSTSTVACGLSGVLTVLNSNSSGLTTFTINIQNLGYVGQAQLNITSYDSLQIYAKQSSLINISVTTPNLISIAANQTNPYLSQDSTYSFNLQLTTSNASTLLLTPPSAIIISSVSCVLNCAPPTKLNIGYLFTITSTNVKIAASVTNPTAFSSTNKFILKTSNSLGDMDYGEHIPQLVCPTPCRSCGVNLTVCLSCYSWSSFPILYNSTCLQVCPSGLFQNVASTGTSSCSSCSTLCISCSGSATNCSSCVNGSFYYNSACYRSCPLGSYTKSNACVSCLQPNCSVCNETTCTACLSGTSFFNGTCLAVCLNNYYSSGGNCVLCASTCLVCSPANGSCLSCISPYFLYEGVCYSTCPSVVFQKLNSALCQPCQAPCATCSGHSTNCTSCLRTYNSSNYYFLQSTCYINQCPDGFYIDSSNNICLACPSNCSTCTISACFSCISPLILYQGKCYSQCPAGTYPNSSICLPCASICKTCISASVCTSCISSYNLFNSSCILTCPAFYYSNLTGNVCLQCSSPCVLCNYAGCLTCISGYYLQENTCTYSCTGLYRPNNSTMQCEYCRSPCRGCTWSDTCTSCIAGYSLFGSECLVSCPSGYYSNGALCITCPSLCPTCTFLNNQPACTSCSNNTLLYSFACVQTCPNDTKASDKYCLSSTCTITNCISCSGSQCVQCAALYQLDSTFQCSSYVNSSAVAAALFKIPVPFPFLICILMILIISFLMKHNFPKMSSPLFIYPLAGGLEFLCICLWTLLSVFWSQGLEQPLPYENVVYAPVLIAIVYFIFNVIQFVLWYFRIAQDKQYKLWQKQDNRCASLSIAIVALLFSFRIDALKFSKTAHNPRLSARLLSPQLFNQYSVLAVLSLALSAVIILVSVYISYMQTSMNYLFFTGIEIAMISIIMIVFSIAMLCVSKTQLLEDKNEYQVGYDQDQIEGKSIEQLLNGLGVVEEHHQHIQYEDSGNAVFRQNSYNSDSYSQDLTQVLPGQRLVLQDKIDSQIELNQSSSIDQAQTVIQSVVDRDQIFKEVQEVQSSSHILVDQIERDRKQALELTEQYILPQQTVVSTYPRQSGAIVKQRLQELHEDSSQVQSMKSFEQFTLNYTKNNYTKQQKEGLSTSKREIQGEFIEEFQLKKIIEEKVKKEEEQKRKQQQKINEQKKEEQRLNQQRVLILAKIKQEEIRKVVEEARRKEEQLNEKRRKEEERLKKIQEQKEREQRWRRMKEEARRKKEQEERILLEEKEAMRKEQEELRLKFQQEQARQKRRQQQQRMLQLQQTRRELQKLNRLRESLKALEGITQQYQAKNSDLQHQQRKLEEQEREGKQRALMAIEDRLSRMTVVFENMWKKAAQIRQKSEKSRKIESSQPQNNNQPEQITYHNDDKVNLVPELSPTKIKVAPRPLPEQYTRRHLFVEEGRQILQTEGQSQTGQQQLQIVFDNNNGPAHIQQQRQVDKPKAIMRHRRPTQTKINHLVYSDKQQELRESNPPIKFAVDAQKLKSNGHKEMPKQDNDEPINMVFQNKLTEQLEEEGSSAWTNPYGLEQQHEPQVEIEDYSARSIHSGSSDTHWPIEPEMQERLLEIERRADRYIKQPKKKEASKEFIYQQMANEIYEEEGEGESGHQQIKEIVFQESECIVEEESVGTQRTKSKASRRKYPLGRVNRRVIDLSPAK